LNRYSPGYSARTGWFSSFGACSNPGPATLAVLAIGFPIALFFSWFYELTPEGLAFDRDVDPGGSVSRIASRRIDFVVIAVLVAGLLLSQESLEYRQNLSNAE